MSEPRESFWRRHRHRLARAVLLATVLLIGTTLMQVYPREVGLRFELGTAHRDVRELRVAYLLDDEEVKGAQFRYPDGLPRSFVRHDVELGPGRYDAQIELILRNDVRRLRRSFTVPSDSLIQIDLSTTGD